MVATRGYSTVPVSPVSGDLVRQGLADEVESASARSCSQFAAPQALARRTFESEPFRPGTQQPITVLMAHQTAFSVAAGR